MNITRKIFYIILVTILFIYLLPTFSVVYAEDTSSDEGLSLTTPAAILMDAKTGKVLFEKNASDKRSIASLTKILTAILTIENCSLDETVVASHYATTSLPSGYSTASILEGEQLTVRQLLDVLLVHSANDAAIILSEHVSGSQENFATLMNKKAKEIGCKNSNFKNASGYQESDHYSTAEDMALIMQYCMKNETFRTLESQTSATLPKTNLAPERSFETTVKILLPESESNPYGYKYAIAGKTGFTTAAQNCLVSVAKKGYLELISCVLGSPKGDDNTSYRYKETIDMFEYGFNNYTYATLKQVGDVIGEATVKNGFVDSIEYVTNEPICVLANTDVTKNTINKEITIEDNLSAPLDKNSPIGKITYIVNDISYTYELYPKTDIAKKELINFKEKTSNANFFENIQLDKDTILIISISVFCFICLIIFICYILKPKKKYNQALNTFNTNYSPNKNLEPNKKEITQDLTAQNKLDFKDFNYESQEMAHTVEQKPVNQVLVVGNNVKKIKISRNTRPKAEEKTIEKKSPLKDDTKIEDKNQEIKSEDFEVPKDDDIVVDSKKLKNNKEKNIEAINAIKKLKQIETSNQQTKKEKEDEIKKEQLKKLENKINTKKTKSSTSKKAATKTTKVAKKKQTKEKTSEKNIEDNSSLIEEIKNEKNKKTKKSSDKKTDK